VTLHAQPRGCIDGGYLARIHPDGWSCGTRRDRSQRYPWCLCTRSTDIGSYETCKNNCVYCYARPAFAGSCARIERELDRIRSAQFRPSGDRVYRSIFHTAPYGTRTRSQS
jgi:hypothetical protein